MDARRARILAGSALATSVLVVTLTAPAAAADCTLTAPAYAYVGTPLTIEGSGFPASASVDIAFSIDGTASDDFTIQSTAAGALEIGLTPENIDLGVTVVQATAGSTCTASVTFTVLAAGATPPPAPTEEPQASTGGAPTAPGTDSDSGVGADRESAGLPWVLALALVGAGSAGLFLTRSPRRR
jgi:hypothetical protein